MRDRNVVWEINGNVGLSLHRLFDLLIVFKKFEPKKIVFNNGERKRRRRRV